MTTRILLVRHGPTAWNAEGRIQGWTDTPLSEAGRAVLARKRVPDAYCRFHCFSSPLLRARETAALLGWEQPQQAAALKEMSWGDWEGCTREELERAYGEDVATRAKLGLDFQPPGGESPRMVQRRLCAWFEQLVDSGQPVIAFSHKGVIRATLALATNWDMKGEMPVTLRWDCGQLFDLGVAGRPALVEANIEL